MTAIKEYDLKDDKDREKVQGLIVSTVRRLSGKAEKGALCRSIVDDLNKRGHQLSRQQVSRQLNNLIAEGRLTWDGQTRATRYYVVHS